MTRPTRTICSRKVEVLVYCECEEQRRNRRNGFPPFHTKTAITQAVWSVSIAWRPIWYNWKVVTSEFSKFGALSDWSVANTMIIDYGRGSRWVTGLLWHDPVVSYGAIILFRGCSSQRNTVLLPMKIQSAITVPYKNRNHKTCNRVCFYRSSRRGYVC